MYFAQCETKYFAKFKAKYFAKFPLNTKRFYLLLHFLYAIFHEMGSNVLSFACIISHKAFRKIKKFRNLFSTLIFEKNETEYFAKFRNFTKVNVIKNPTMYV